MIRLKPKWDYCGNKLNKRFKTDSQRVAFLPCVDFSDLGVCRNTALRCSPLKRALVAKEENAAKAE